MPGRLQVIEYLALKELVTTGSSIHWTSPARELGQQVRGIGDLAVGRDLARARAGDAARELRVARGEHQRQKFVRQQIAKDAGVVGVELVPREIVLRVERNLRRLAQPAVPVKVGFLEILIHRVAPLAVLGIVPAVAALRPDERA